MREEDYDGQIGGTIAAFSSYLVSVIDHVKALIKENAVVLSIKAFLIFSGAMVTLIALSFFMFGAAKGLSRALGVELWLGVLFTGTGFLLVTLLFFTSIFIAAKKRASKKKAEQKKAAEILSRKVSDIVDVKKWIQEYPFYSTGAAAAAGFTLSGAITPGNSKEREPETSSSELHSAGLQAAIIAMVLALAEDVLKEAVVPFVKEHLRPKEDTETQDFAQ